MQEKALLLGSQQSLVGVYTQADTEEKSLTQNCVMVFLNAGLTHHVGPHRLHVKLARQLATIGISSLRLDLSGIGDSNVSAENMPVQELAMHELTEIMDDLGKYGHTDFIFFGVCSGGKLALQIAARDARVKGIIVVNQSLAADDPELAAQISADLYMKSSIWRPKAWLNLFSGRVNYKRLWQSLSRILSPRPATGKNKKTSLAELVSEEITPVLSNDSRLLMLFSDQHEKFIDLRNENLTALQTNELLEINVFPDTDHLFTQLDEQNKLIQKVMLWMRYYTDNSSVTP